MAETPLCCLFCQTAITGLPAGGPDPNTAACVWRCPSCHRVFDTYAQANWQPIETAPTDGRRILGWDGQNLQTTWFAEGHRTDWRYGVVGDYEGELEFYPTHWMSLPSPPEVSHG